MGFSPRPATEDDLDQIVAIDKTANSPPWSRPAFQSELEKKQTHFWVVTEDEDDDQILAYAVVAAPAEQAHLQTFAVHPSQRRRGLGSYLMRQLIAFLMRQKVDSLVLEVRRGNAAAIQLYQSLGFVVIHTMKSFYPDGEDAFSMIYLMERNKLSGDPDVDFDADTDGKKNIH